MIQQLMLTLEEKLEQPKTLQTKKTYQKYTVKMRLQLIKLVSQQNLSTAEAARLVGIKQTSACRIMASYRNHNRVFERKTERLFREIDANVEQMEKRYGKQQKAQLGKSENLGLGLREAPFSQKYRENRSDAKLEEHSSTKNTPQLIIPTPFLPQMTTIPQNTWNTVAYGQNPVWSWPFFCPYY